MGSNPAGRIADPPGAPAPGGSALGSGTDSYPVRAEGLKWWGTSERLTPETAEAAEGSRRPIPPGVLFPKRLEIRQVLGSSRCPLVGYECAPPQKGDFPGVDQMDLPVLPRLGKGVNA